MSDLIPLSRAQLALLRSREAEALARCGRVDFGGGVLNKLTRAFADSPHIQRDELAQTLCALTELFYEFKNITRDALDDDELLLAMAALFDGPAQGSVERLGDASAALLLRAASGEPCRSMDDGEPDANSEKQEEGGDDAEAW